MNPLNLNPSRGPDALERLVFAGKPLTVADFDVVPEGPGDDAVEADLLHYEGQAFYRVSMRDASVILTAARDGVDRWPNLELMKQRAAELVPDANVSSFEVLSSYDDYYYTRRPEHAEKSLPIVRVRFDDSEATWFHLDPTTGQVVERLTRTNRVYRWLYNGLHSWDIRWLWERRPLWDICVIAFSLGGFLLSVIGVWIGVRRLRNPHGVTRHARLRALRPALEADPIS
jgi:hypothetical protein